MMNLARRVAPGAAVPASNAARLVVATALLLTLPAAATATTLSGLSRLTPSGPAASSLTRQGVTLTAEAGAERVRTGRATTYLLAAGDTTFATTSRVELGGALVLRRRVAGRTRTIRLSALQVRLGKARVVSAEVGGRRLDLFTLDLRAGEFTVDAKTTVVRIGGTRASLTRPATAAIGKALALRARRAGDFGVLSLAASAPVPSAPGAPATPGATTTDPSGASAPATGGAPPTNPITGGTYAPPTPRPRPAGAVDVISSALRWHLRESFVRYVRSGEGVAASAGATAGPPAADGVAYDYDFTPAGGWYDPATGAARLLFTGVIRFSYAGHGIDIQFADPQVELAGDASRVLATFVSSKASSFSGVGEFAALELGKAQTAGSAGPLIVLSALPARITPWANEAVMSGFYPAPDDAFGQLDLRFTRAG